MPKTKREIEIRESVMVRFELDKVTHREAMSIHANNPRTMTFADTMAEIVAAGCKALRSETETPGKNGRAH